MDPAPPTATSAAAGHAERRTRHAFRAWYCAAVCPLFVAGHHRQQPGSCLGTESTSRQAQHAHPWAWGRGWAPHWCQRCCGWGPASHQRPAGQGQGAAGALGGDILFRERAAASAQCPPRLVATQANAGGSSTCRPHLGERVCRCLGIIHRRLARAVGGASPQLRRQLGRHLAHLQVVGRRARHGGSRGRWSSREQFGAPALSTLWQQRPKHRLGWPLAEASPEHAPSCSGSSPHRQQVAAILHRQVHRLAQRGSQGRGVVVRDLDRHRVGADVAVEALAAAAGIKW